MTRKTIRTSKRKKTMRRKSKSINNNNKSLPSPIKKASHKYTKTCSLKKAKIIFKAQALANARKLFGYNITNG